MSASAPVYVVDDDPSVREAVESLVRSAGLRVETFASAQEFLDTPRRDMPGCLVLDVQLPGLSGLDLQQELARADAQIPIIFLSGHADVPMSVRAMKAGALEFLIKPFAEDDLLRAIEDALARTASLRPHREPSGPIFEGIVGASPAMQNVIEQIEAVAPMDSTVLILGETGTGKELVARAIHRHSRRAGEAFVDVNCAAIPQGLVGSELFGHERGAFTGAMQRRAGRFEQAQRGTIFLDEVGELPAETQISLLRVLQERMFTRVGGNQPIQADVRVIAATNRDLRQAIGAGTFRSDLFYRVNVFPIAVPPLRQRREDIPLLVKHFVSQLEARRGEMAGSPGNPGNNDGRHRVVTFADGTLRLLQSHDWPGNVRELQNVVERAWIVAEGEELSVDERWLMPERTSDEGSSPPLAAVMTDHEKRLIEGALTETKGQVSGATGAAAKLGMKSSTLESKIRSLNIDKRRFKTIYRRGEW